MKALQLLLVTLTALTSCAKKPNAAPVVSQHDTTITKPMPNTTTTYLALGDSYTIGQSVPLNDSFPYQLVNVLNTQDGFHVDTADIIATTGWTTEQLISAISYRKTPTNHYDIVTLLIGVNDQYEGNSQADYQTQFAQVLQTAINSARDSDKTRVFVLSIPDYGVTPFAMGKDSVIGPQIDQFNAINKSISLRFGVNYVDITAISREAATDPSLIADDGLHPSEKMYAIWIQLLAPVVAARLSK
jgi:lysophospholipase L1-like esterase